MGALAGGRCSAGWQPPTARTLPCPPARAGSGRASSGSCPQPVPALGAGTQTAAGPLGPQAHVHEHLNLPSEIPGPPQIEPLLEVPLDNIAACAILTAEKVPVLWKSCRNLYPAASKALQRPLAGSRILGGVHPSTLTLFGRVRLARRIGQGIAVYVRARTLLGLRAASTRAPLPSLITDFHDLYCTNLILAWEFTHRNIGGPHRSVDPLAGFVPASARPPAAP